MNEPDEWKWNHAGLNPLLEEAFMKLGELNSFYPAERDAQDLPQSSRSR